MANSAQLHPDNLREAKRLGQGIKNIILIEFGAAMVFGVFLYFFWR